MEELKIASIYFLNLQKIAPIREIENWKSMVAIDCNWDQVIFCCVQQGKRHGEAAERMAIEVNNTDY